MGYVLNALWQREIKSVWRQRGELVAGLLFSLLILSLFPFALAPAPEILARFAPGLISVIILLAQLLGLERLFTADWHNGTLDRVALQPGGLLAYAAVKTLAHWLGCGLPLLCASPLYMLLLAVPAAQMGDGAASLLLSTAALSLLGTAAAALAVGARRAGLLLPLLLIPFYIPVLIFAVQWASLGLHSAEGRQAAWFLVAMVVLYLPVLPWLASAGLRAAVESA